STQRFPQTQCIAPLCRSRWKTQHNAFLKLNASLPKGRSTGRVVGRELSFTEDFVVIPTIDLEIQLFVGLVMIESILLGSSLQLLSRGFYRTYLKLHFVVNI
ncbi:hypothetical protein, partial [Leptospira interrogans]|uniref:hypothetical protein n=1 Tax=Leptospira interrogans TaxID=173 RepID=UPI001F37B7F3